MVDLKTSYLFKIFFIIGYTKDILAERCSFVTPKGVHQFRFCEHQCCEGSNRTASTVCCSYEYDGLYIGVGVSSVVISALIVFFCVYYCFKHKRDDRSRRRECLIIYTRQSSNTTTATDDTLQHEIPSVSFHVSYMVPPPYETRPPPPPYHTDFRKTSDKGEHNDAFDPGEQPPAYTSHQTI